MILPDINVLLPAVDRANTLHQQAVQWLQRVELEDAALAIPDLIVAGTVRVLSSPKMQPNVIAPAQTLEFFDDLTNRTHVRTISAGPRFARLFMRALDQSGFTGAKATDAHIAALAAEHGCRIATRDKDFEKFSMVGSFDPFAAEEQS